MKYKQFVLSSVSELKNLQGTRLSKYTRNFRLYESTRGISLDSIRTQNNVGFYKDSSDWDTSPDISLNVIKSCTDTLASDMSAIKVRPYFSTVNGSWKDVQITKTAQRFFDQYLEYKNVSKEVVKAFKNACIFDTGVLFVDPFLKEVKSVLPYQVYIRPAEATYNKITKCYYEMKDYPTVNIPGYKGKAEYTTFGYYFDTTKHIMARMIADTNTVEVYDYTADEVPFIFLHYQDPVVGTSSSSIADILAPIQIAINFLLNRYKDASQKNPAQTFFVPEGSNIEAYKLNNQIGNIITYATTSNMTSSPVTVSTPNFIDGQYLDGVERLKQLAYEMVGLSQASATGQKAKGLDSGIALQTMENIESERFQTQTDMVVRTYKDLTRLMMHVFNPEDDILESDMFTSPFKWKDIVSLADKMKVQFSSSDNISKDPATKIQTIQMLQSIQAVPNEMLLKMLSLPDIDLSLNVMNNTWDSIQACINDCIENDVYDVPCFVPYPALQKEILNTQLMLFSADRKGNEEAIMKLTKLFEVCFHKNQNLTAYMQQSSQQSQQSQGVAQ